MATKITVALEDDLDGRPAVETVRFSVGGTEYEIDLNKKNAAAFRKNLAPFIEHARRAGRGRRRLGRSAAGRERGAAIRVWANEQGIAVSARGRIPADVVAQYDAARGGADAGWIAVGAESAGVLYVALDRPRPGHRWAWLRWGYWAVECSPLAVSP